MDKSMTEDAPITLADTGLGTTYERWALNRVLQHIQQVCQIQSVLEGPGDGMTGIAGINSIVLGRQGIRVTLHLMDSSQAAYAEKVWTIHAPQASLEIVIGPNIRFPDWSYDLVWNFNILPCASDPGMLLAEMARVSRRYVFFCVSNAGNYSFWLHRLHHRVAKQRWDHGDIAWMRPAPWLALLADKGLRLCEVFYLDCPWWPDIVNPAELIMDFFPFLKRAPQKAVPENRMKWEPATLPYYDPERYPEIHQKLQRLAFFEDNRLPLLKRLFGHHFGILAEKL
jgi:SAM-dependent methyltransferase